MDDISGYTVSDLMLKTRKTRSAIESWLSRHKIKPLSYEAIYPLDTLEKLLNAKPGRPKKSKPETETSKVLENNQEKAQD